MRVQQPTSEGHSRTGSTVSAAGTGGARSDRIHPWIRRSSSSEHSLLDSPSVQPTLPPAGFVQLNPLYLSQPFMMVPSPVQTESTFSSSLGATTSPVADLPSSPTSTAPFGPHHCGSHLSHGASCSRPFPALSSLSPSSGTSLPLKDTQASSRVSFSKVAPTFGPTHTASAIRQSLHEPSLITLSTAGQT